MDTERVSASVEPISVQSALRAQINEQLTQRLLARVRMPTMEMGDALAESYRDPQRGWQARVEYEDQLGDNEYGDPAYSPRWYLVVWCAYTEEWPAVEVMNERMRQW